MQTVAVHRGLSRTYPSQCPEVCCRPLQCPEVYLCTVQTLAVRTMRRKGSALPALCVWTAGLAVLLLHVTLVQAECPHQPAGKTLRRWSDDSGWTSVDQTVREPFSLYLVSIGRSVPWLVGWLVGGWVGGLVGWQMV